MKKVERLAIGEQEIEEQEILREIGVYLRKAYRQADAGRIQEEEYERYVELWTHEVKIPLSLFTLLLENRSEEMSPTVYKKNGACQTADAVLCRADVILCQG